MPSIEGYRVAIGAFYLILGHRIYKSSKIFYDKYVVTRQAFQYSICWDFLCVLYFSKLYR